MIPPVESSPSYSVPRTLNTDVFTQGYRVSRQTEKQTEYNVINIPPLAYILEMEDASFSHNSAVPWLYLPPIELTPHELESKDFPPSFFQAIKHYHPELYASRRNLENYKGLSVEPVERCALSVIAIALFFLKENPDFHLLLAGHTDTSGSDEYNFTLSDLRAEAVHSLLTGNREQWVTIVNNKSNVIDYQAICHYFNRYYGWPCDPGPIDDHHGQNTDTAVEAFQDELNKFIDSQLTVDGQVGPATWGAIFDMYQVDLKMLMRTDEQGLCEARDHIRWVHNEHFWIGCGERFPIDLPAKNHFRSKENRRVEFLFFSNAYLPNICPHLPGGSMRTSSAQRTHSSIYGLKYYRFLVLKVMTWHGSFGFGSTKERKLQVILDPPEISKEPLEQGEY